MTGAPILIVEDEPAIRRLLVVVFERQGLPVEATGEGAEALPLIRSGRFGVVLLDLMMPGMSGFQILEAVRDMPAASRPVFLVITATPATRLTLDPELVSGIIQKPFDVDTVIGMVREVLNARQNVKREA